MNLNMRNKEDLGPTEQADNEIFQLSQITSKRQLDKITDQRPDVVAESDDEEPQVPVKKSKKVSYDAEKSYLDETGTYVNIFYVSVSLPINIYTNFRNFF